MPRQKKQKFAWKEGSRLPTSLDAQKVGEELLRIKNGSGGMNLDLVIEEARNTDNPLHTGFEWNDSKAAQNYRRSQARNIIHAVYVVSDDTEPQPLFYAVHEEGARNNSKHKYILTSIITVDEELQQRLINEALNQLRGWIERCSRINRIAPLANKLSEQLEHFLKENKEMVEAG